MRKPIVVFNSRLTKKSETPKVQNNNRGENMEMWLGMFVFTGLTSWV